MAVVVVDRVLRLLRRFGGGSFGHVRVILSANFGTRAFGLPSAFTPDVE